MNNICRIISGATAAILLSACSSIIQGTSQKIAVSTSPSGAFCTLSRNGDTVGTVVGTPGSVTVGKTKDDILVKCALIGYAPAAEYLHSGIATGTYGNIIAGGLIGWGVDSMTGADNEYPSNVNLNLAPQADADAALPPTATAGLPSCTRQDAEIARDALERGYQYHPACR